MRARVVFRERAAGAAGAADSGGPGARRRRRALGRGTVPASRGVRRRVRRVHDGRRGLVSRGQALRPPGDEAPVPCVAFARFLRAPDGVPLRALGEAYAGALEVHSRPLDHRAAARGATRLGWPSFLLFNGAGVVIWAGTAIAAGMLFHAQINELIARLEGLGTLAAEAIGVLLGGYIALKWWERRRFYRMLRIARIGVDEL